MTDTVVVQPWTQYPPALANVRILNQSSLELDGVKTEQTTVMLLEPLWVWGKRYIPKMKSFFWRRVLKLSLVVEQVLEYA